MDGHRLTQMGIFPPHESVFIRVHLSRQSRTSADPWLKNFPGPDAGDRPYHCGGSRGGPPGRDNKAEGPHGPYLTGVGQGQNKKTKSPRPVFRLNEGKLGAGSSPCSLSHADIRRILADAASFPTPFSTASGVLRPHSRAVQRLAVAEFRVRPLGSLELAFADAGSRTRSRHLCDFFSRLDHFALGRPPLLAMRWPSATGLTS
jgi:hypothetical protein